MSGFTDILSSSDATKHRMARGKALVSVESVVNSVTELDKDTIKHRVFKQTEETFLSRKESLLKAHDQLINFILSKNPDLITDKDYAEFQRELDDKILSWSEIFADINDLLQAKLGLPQEAKHDDVLDKLIEQLAANQLKFTTAITDSSKKRNAPRPQQPMFVPKNSDEDYLNFKSFLEKFDFFVKSVEDDGKKLQWLQNSLKGSAYECVKAYSLQPANYALARAALVKDFQNLPRVKAALLEKVTNCQFDRNDQSMRKVLAQLTALKNNIEELKTVFLIDIFENSAEQVIRHVVFSRLPGQLKNELMNMTDTMFPSLKQIFDNSVEAVDRIQQVRDNQSQKSTGRFGQKKEDTSPDAIGSIAHSGSTNKKSRRRVKKSGVKPHTKEPPASESVSINLAKKTTRKVSCSLCSGGHSTRLCAKFPDIPSRKKAFHERHGVNPCEVCFQPIHTGKCNPRSVCSLRLCTKQDPHSIVLCPVNIETTKRLNVGLIFSIGSRLQRSVALETAVFAAMNVNAKSLPQAERNIAVLCDNGAQRSLVTEDCARKLGLKVLRKERACLQGFGQRTSQNQLYEVVEVKLGQPFDKNPIVLDAMVVKNLNRIYMAGASQFAKKLHAKGIDLADWRFLRSKNDLVTTDVLVGMDHYRKAVSPHSPPQLVLGMWLNFTVTNKALLSGKIPGSAVTNSSQSVNSISIMRISSPPPLQVLEQGEVVEDCNAQEVVRELNSFESLGIRLSSREEDDRDALEIFNSRFHYDEEGRPVVGFPWIDNSPPSHDVLDSNFNIVRSRFDSVMKYLDKHPDKRKQYEEVHSKELSNQFIEPVPEAELNDPTVFRHYINHFPVYKQDERNTTKVRRVFDASLHKRGKHSLNDFMLPGSQLTPHIYEVSLRLRLLQYLLCADISKAFMRMLLQEPERNFTCFFARKDFNDPNSPVLVYRFRSVIFGATSSPFLLNCTVADILQHNDFDHLLEVFVDNLFVMFNDTSQILPAVESLLGIFEKAGMPLHEFATNVREVNDSLRSRAIFTNSEILKLLGLDWNFVNDLWFVRPVDLDLEKITKRAILSAIARIFDIMGFLSPVTILARVLIQEAWESGLSWDELLPDDMQVNWRDLVGLLKDALKIPIPRWVGFSSFEGVSVHCFTDASAKCLGAVIYLVGGNRSIFYTSKAKVCPVRQDHFSIPRKELCAMSIGVRLLKFVLVAVGKYFKPVSLHLWADATTPLTWLVSKKPHKDLFIRSRVDEMVAKKDAMDFRVHYVLGTTNPADLMTKRADDPLRSDLWNYGPELLLHPEQWQDFAPSAAAIDAIPIFCGNVVLPPGYQDALPDVEKYDSLDELHSDTLKAHAVLHGSGHISVAIQLWVKNVQLKHFGDAITFLGELNGAALKSVAGKSRMREQKLSPPPICSSLHLFLDAKGLIRVNTSLANAPGLSYEQKFPLLLPAVDPYSKLLVRYCHEAVGHLGLNTTRARLRQSYWVPKVTCLIKKVISGCEVCKQARGRRYHVPHSPPLPSFRFNVEEPFGVTAVDMTGHEWVSPGGSQPARKVYFLVFVCAATGAAHIEMVEDCTSSSFGNAFERFVSRRGLPFMLLSDRGSNFTGYQSDLEKLATDQSLENILFSKGIVWRFFPSNAPHFNGLVERHLGILKSVLRKSIGKAILNQDQLLTVACYAESIHNQRPLAIMDADDVNFVPITPNFLLYGRNLQSVCHEFSAMDLDDPDYVIGKQKLSSVARKLKSTLTRIRNVWIHEYLHFLALKDPLRQSMAPATKSVLLPSTGDSVLIKDGKWLRVGKIVEIFCSDDTEIRSARVKTENGEGVYPICNLRFLERNTPNDLTAPEVSKKVELVNKRPRRKAAAEAQAKFMSANLIKCSYIPVPCE